MHWFSYQILQHVQGCEVLLMLPSVHVVQRPSIYSISVTESSSDRNFWHFAMSTLTASLTKTSGGKIPVDSTETEKEEQNISQWLHPNVVRRTTTVV